MNQGNNDFYLYGPWIYFKQSQFFDLGYTEVSSEDLWNYCLNFLWKHKRPDQYYLEVEDILSIQPNEYFNYASLKATVYDVPSLDEMKLDDLLT